MGSAVFHAVSAQNGTPVMGCVQNTLTMAGVCTNIFDSPRQTGDEPTCCLPNGEPGYEIMISRNTVKRSIMFHHIIISSIVKIVHKYN